MRETTAEVICVLEMEAEKARCKELFPEWQNLPNDSISLQCLPGASNKVYLAETSLESPTRKIIYRIFGAADIIDIGLERQVFDRLSELGFGPHSFGCTSYDRVEEFINGRPLERLELRDPHMVKLICQALRSLHEQDMTGSVDCEKVATVENAKTWRDMALAKLATLGIGEEEKSDIDELLSESMQSLWLELMPFWAPRAFLHHDCNRLNFLYVQSQDTIRLIDYEYAGYGFRGMDLGFTINELMYDYTTPTPPYWSYFPESLYDESLLTCYVKAYGGDAGLWAETRMCLVCGHYFWAVWSVAMAKAPREGFDYIKYALLRLNDFRREVRTVQEMGGLQGVRRRAETAMLT